MRSYPTGISSHMVAYMNHSRKQFNNHSGSSSTIVSFFVSVCLIQFSILLMHSYVTEGLNLHIITHIYILEPNAKKQGNNQNAINLQSQTSDVKTKRTNDRESHTHWIQI
jgi:hypothetical protein